MTGETAFGSATARGADRVARAERALWDRYGLRPRARIVGVGSPPAKLRVLDLGAGEPVLFVHGTIGSGAWMPLVGALPGVRSLVLDRPGWAPSDAVDFARRSYRAVAGDTLRDVLDSLGVDRVDVVGGSIGDVWALSLAERHPSRVGRIVLLGGGPVVRDFPVPAFIQLIRSPLGALIVRLPTTPGRIRTILRQNGHGASLDAGRIPPELIEWRALVANHTRSMRHERTMIRSVIGPSGFRRGATFDARDLAEIVQPALLVHGTADPSGDVDLWRRTMGYMPAGEVQLIEGGGHQPWLDDPAAVAAMMTRFLAEAQTGRSRSAGPM